MRPTLPSSQGRLIAIAAGVVVVAGLRLGREVLMPLALSMLLAFLLAPPVRWLERLRVGRVVAVLVVSMLAFALIVGLGYVIALQGIDLTTRLPEYRQNIVAKIQSLTPDEDNPFAKALETLQGIEQEVSKPAAGGAGERADGGAPAQDEPRDDEPPVPVEVVDRRSMFERLTAAAGPLLGPLGTAGIVVVLVIFMLIGREDLRDRVVFLLGRGDVHLTTRALEDAGGRVSRYLGMQVLVNTIYALPVALALYLLDVPNALMWAAVGFGLRFVPYVGPLVAAGMPILLALAHFDGWSRPIAVAGMYVGVELLINNLVEPWLYGSSTGMSSVAVIVSAVFWTWVWGPIGLLMATPLTATLVAFGRHTPQFETLSTLLGDEPAGEPPARFYQRLVALDHEGAAEVAREQFEADASAVKVFDDIVLPALQQAHTAHRDGTLSDERLRAILAIVEAIADELTEAARVLRADGIGERTQQRFFARAAVLCLPARPGADQGIAHALAELLGGRGHRADVSDAALMVSDRVSAVEQFAPDAVVISALPPTGLAHVRLLCKRLQQRFPTLRIVVGAWLLDGDEPRLRERAGLGDHGAVVHTFAGCFEDLERFAHKLPAHSGAGAAPPPPT